jgi:hypothetical protein
MRICSGPTGVEVDVRVLVGEEVGLPVSAAEVPVAFTAEAVAVRFAAAVLVRSAADAVAVRLAADAVAVRFEAAVPVRFAAAVTVNGSMQSAIELDELRGEGALLARSTLLSSVSEQSLLRMSAVVLLGAGAGAAPSKKSAVPYPTRSTMLARSDGEQGVAPPLHAIPLVVLARITFPAVAPISVEPLASGVGNKLPTEPPDASCIR